MCGSSWPSPSAKNTSVDTSCSTTSSVGNAIMKRTASCWVVVVRRLCSRAQLQRERGAAALCLLPTTQPTQERATATISQRVRTATGGDGRWTTGCVFLFAVCVEPASLEKVSCNRTELGANSH
eukprot:m.131764 g.131764  ORF g.131764 m.131764 type:complete len:124 (+) comp16827_c0_seq2:493-864(+)